MKATKNDARKDIRYESYEEMLPASRKDKRRNCVFCGNNIPPDVVYYRHFEYPYEPNQKRWFACESCFELEKQNT